MALPDLKQARIDEVSAAISTAASRTLRDTTVRPAGDTSLIRSEQERMRYNMLWLWKASVRPVLDELVEPKSQRVWWIAGGSTGRLPFHAAGDPSQDSIENTISQVISSYTATFKVLKYSADKPRSRAYRGQMLLVDMPKTPGYENLDTGHEVATIKSQFGHGVTHLKNPTKSDVLRQLTNSDFVHFACHGMADSQDPSKSGVLMVEKGISTLLTIAELDQINLQDAEIAYLPACSTAELPAGKSLDEGIHLSNSFQMLGFKHVIGSMWSANDYAAGIVARRFYTKLRRGHQESREEYQVSRAVHDAVRKFRNEPGVRENVALLGCFIHIGA